MPEGSTDIQDIKNLYYYEAIAMGVVWLMVVVYFPSAPPTAPSLSRSVTSPPFFDGLGAAGVQWALLGPCPCVRHPGRRCKRVDVDARPVIHFPVIVAQVAIRACFVRNSHSILY